EVVEEQRLGAARPLDHGGHAEPVVADDHAAFGAGRLAVGDAGRRIRISRAAAEQGERAGRGEREANRAIDRHDAALREKMTSAMVSGRSVHAASTPASIQGSAPPKVCVEYTPTGPSTSSDPFIATTTLILNAWSGFRMARAKISCTRSLKSSAPAIRPRSL